MTSSVDLAEKLQKRHSNLTKVIKQYQKDFKTFGKLVINKGKEQENHLRSSFLMINKYCFYYYCLVIVKLQWTTKKSMSKI